MMSSKLGLSFCETLPLRACDNYKPADSSMNILLNSLPHYVLYWGTKQSSALLQNTYMNDPLVSYWKNSILVHKYCFLIFAQVHVVLNNLGTF